MDETGKQMYRQQLKGKQAELRGFISDHSEILRREYWREKDRLGSYNKAEELAPQLKTSGALSHYSKEQIEQMAQETKEIADKYTKNESKWSGKTVILSDDYEKYDCAKRWNCDIATKRYTSKYALLHEQLHAHSISYYGIDEYIVTANIEEGTIDLLAEEIAKQEGIPIESSGYETEKGAIRTINRILNIYDTDLEIAKNLIDIPAPERYDYLYKQCMRRAKIFRLNEAEFASIMEALEVLR